LEGERDGKEEMRRGRQEENAVITAEYEGNNALII